MRERAGRARLLGACLNGGWPVVLRRMGLMRRIFDMSTDCLRSAVCCLLSAVCCLLVGSRYAAMDLGLGQHSIKCHIKLAIPDAEQP